MRPKDNRSQNDCQGLTLIELLIVVSILGVASTMIYTGYLRERNRTLSYAVANGIAGWLDATRRSSERGAACLVTLYPSTSVNTSYTLATGEVYPGLASSIPNQCQSANPLKIEMVSDNSIFSVTLPSGTPTSFIFTPRGTMFNPSAPSTGDFTDSVRVRINVIRSGLAQLPSYCVILKPPLGEIDISLSTSTSC